MAISVLNSAGSAVTLKSTTDSGDEVPHHKVDSVAIPTAGVQLVVTVAATAAVVATHALTSGVNLLAATGNTGDVFIGFSSSVTTTGATKGYPLKAGGTVFLELSNTNLIYTIGTASDVLDIIGS